MIENSILLTGIEANTILIVLFVGTVQVITATPDIGLHTADANISIDEGTSRIK